MIRQLRLCFELNVRINNIYKLYTLETFLPFILKLKGLLI